MRWRCDHQAETDSLIRALFDHITVAGSLDAGEWTTFKERHPMTPEQCEAVLLATVGHLCTMVGELTAEVGRLSLALSRRG